MKGLFKEPLFHFLVLGALIFAAYSWLNHAADPAGERAGAVRITTNDVVWLTEMWSRQWQREPTRDELRGMVAELLKEQLLAAEARAIGLDENDTIVRRRLAQKLEFLVQDTSRLAEPTEEDLRRFYEANLERYKTPARVSFAHIYFSRDRRADAAADAKAALTELRADAERAEKLALQGIGDRLLTGSEFTDADEETVAAQFGKEFGRDVFAVQPGVWTGPFESGYGLHLVRVGEKKPGQQHDFAEVKAEVLERWRDQRQREDNQKYFAGLLKKYEIIVDESLKPLIQLEGSVAAHWPGSGEKTR